MALSIRDSAVSSHGCEDCRTPKSLVSNLVMGCTLCGLEHIGPRPDGRITANPIHCLECNP